MNKRKAEYYEITENLIARCKLCPHECAIPPGGEGICWARKNEDGTLYAQNYGRTTSLAIDPIEKKPLFHFKPGSEILSVSPNGCNMRCPFCQNYTISFKKAITKEIVPEELVKMAKEYNTSSIAFTYAEPIIWFEFIKDTAKYAKKEEIDLVMVTNGLISKEPLNDLLEIVSAMNIDLKSMNPEYYKKVLKGNLEYTKNTIEEASKKIHVEITNLLIPGDNDMEIEKLAKYLASIDKNIPLHISRYFPNNNYNKPPTPINTLEEAYNTARKYLNYVYVGNASLQNTENTYCPECSGVLIERKGFNIKKTGIDKGKCSNCGRKTDFVL